jgi:two-component sensor histidine kinase
MTMREAVAGNLPHTSAATRAARDLVAPLADEAPESTAATLRLLVTELVANCVVHGGRGGDIELQADIDAERRLIRAQVTCAAGSSGPRLRPVGAGPGGYGLRLLDALSARWGVLELEGRTRVWFHLSVTDPAADVSGQADQRRVHGRHHQQRGDEDGGEGGALAYRHDQVLAIPA